MIGCFVTRIARYLQVWNLARPVHDSVGGGKGTQLDLDVMIHMKLIEMVGDAYRVVGTSGSGLSFQGTSNMSNDEVLARMMSRMDIFDTRLNGMETMIADHFQSIEIMNESLDSRMDTMQGQLQTILQLLQPPLPSKQ
ncbi:hypothetical protein JCGZ_12808 [Jatropha curcas]|uniref:Uncharacterized protein n=1 Tax=Jatropha curcas TaxID=180498 RepID=A0A067KR45_JATCU|nr:hypothetical protein JCGZ_12808 [Jatropha curcas]